VTFSEPTNRPLVTTKANLDNLFTFSQNLGADYIGTWISPTILAISILDSTGATPPAVGSLTLTVKASGNLKNAAGTSLASTARSPLLSGDFGTRAGPSITSLVAADPDGGDAVYGNGDTITVRFDEPTNQPAVATKANLDALFTFSQSLGDDYSGTWDNSRTLRITIIDSTTDSPPQIGVLQLTVKASGNLKNAAGTSLASTSVSPVLTGTFGTRAGPSITSLVAADQFGRDAVYGNDDTITVRFDEPTNQPAVATKANLDTVFTFSQNLGADYTGRWVDPSILLITIRDSTGAAPPVIGTFRVSVNLVGNLKNAAGTSLPSDSQSSALTGNFGTRAGPSITSLVAADPDSGDAVYGNGDTITVRFSEQTNQPAVATKANLDALFTFSQSLGTSYVGVWINPSTLVITTLDSTGATPPAVGSLTLTVKASSNLKNAAGTSLASTATSPLLDGSFGDKVGPSIVSFVADDPDNSDSIFSSGDTLTIRFDDATNQPAVATKANLDALFTFSQSLGDDYSGSWTQPNTLIITITDSTSDAPPVIGELVATINAAGNLKNAAGTSLPSTSLSPVLTGTFGTFVEVIPVADGGTAISILPSGITSSITLPDGVSGIITVTRTTGLDTLNATATIDFLGTVVDIAPSEGADCSLGCEISFDFTQADADAEGIDPFDAKVYHDENDDGDFGDTGEILDTTITQLDTDLFRASATIDSNSKFAVGGIRALAIGFAAVKAGVGGFDGTGSAQSQGPAPSLGSVSVASLGNPSQGFGGVIGSSDLASTRTVKTGEQVTLRFDLYEDKGVSNVAHVEIEMNNKGDTRTQSDARIIFDKSKPLVIDDPNKFISSADFTILEKDQYNMVLKLDITFAKSMGTRNVLLKVLDLDKNSVTKEYTDLIHVISSTELKEPEQQNTYRVPGWIKTNAGWWSEGQVSDTEFVQAMQYLIENKVIKIPQTDAKSTGVAKVPSWIKTNAGWWSDNLISDNEFVSGIQFLMSNGIIRI
jgi:hypothetical protein